MIWTMSCYYFSPKLEVVRSGNHPALHILEQCPKYDAVGCCCFPAEHHTFGGLEFLERSLGATHYAEAEAKCSRENSVM